MSAIVHPPWCHLPDCTVTETKTYGVHLSAPAIVNDPDPGAPMHAEVRLMLGHPEGARLFDVRLVHVIYDPEDVDLEPTEFPLPAAQALNLAETIQRLAQFAGWAEGGESR